MLFDARSGQLLGKTTFERWGVVSRRRTMRQSFVMNEADLQGKILYFEMHTRPPDKSALFFTKGWAKMDASKSGHVSIMLSDHPGAVGDRSVTLMPDCVAKFRKNESGETFDLRGQKITPDFIYIEPPMVDF